MDKIEYCDCGVPNHLHGTACGWVNAGVNVAPSNEEEREWLRMWSKARIFNSVIIDENGRYISCPFCNAHMLEYTTVKCTLKVKGEDVTTDYSLCRCKNCEVEFTTDEIDQINIDNFKQTYLNQKNLI